MLFVMENGACFSVRKKNKHENENAEMASMRLELLLLLSLMLHRSSRRKGGQLALLVVANQCKRPENGVEVNADAVTVIQLLSWWADSVEECCVVSLAV